METIALPESPMPVTDSIYGPVVFPITGERPIAADSEPVLIYEPELVRALDAYLRLRGLVCYQRMQLQAAEERAAAFLKERPRLQRLLAPL